MPNSPAALPAEAEDSFQPPPPANDADNIYFASGAAQVDEPAKDMLRRHALRLKGDSELVVTLVAYTDPLGSRSYNLAVAEERIEAVAETLRQLGVPRHQIRRVNGGQRPSVSPTCATPACQQQPSRVELVY